MHGAFTYRIITDHLRERLETLAFWGELPAEASPFNSYSTLYGRVEGANKSPFLLLVSF